MTISETRQTARYERKREAILEAAAKLFNSRGLNGTTLADVAQNVGLTTTSVTYYYRRKEDLAAACVTCAIEGLDELFGIAAKEPTPPARLRRFVTLYMAMVAEAATGLRPVIISLWDVRGLSGPSAEMAFNAIADLFRRVRVWFADPLGPSLSHGEQNARTFLVLSALIFAKEWVHRYEVEDYPRCARCLADALIDGIAGPGIVWTTPAPNPRPPRPSIPEISRESFLRAATELVNEHGYHGASVDRISAKLSVTKGSFYHHNVTKDDLVAQCFERTFEVIRAVHRTAPPEAGNGWQRLCAIAVALVRYQRSEHGPLVHNTALAGTPDDKHRSLIDQFGRVANMTAGVIVDGIADRSIRPLDPAIAAQFFAGMVNAASELHHWVRDVTEEQSIILFVRPSLLGVFSRSAF